jgi:hypothetical protein
MYTPGRWQTRRVICRSRGPAQERLVIHPKGLYDLGGGFLIRFIGSQTRMQLWGGAHFGWGCLSRLQQGRATTEATKLRLDWEFRKLVGSHRTALEVYRT